MVYFRETINCPDVRMSRFRQIIVESAPTIQLHEVTKDQFKGQLENHLRVANRKLQQLRETSEDYYKFDWGKNVWVPYFGKFILHLENVILLVQNTLGRMLETTEEQISWDHPVARAYYVNVLNVIINRENLMGSDNIVQ